MKVWYYSEGKNYSLDLITINYWIIINHKHYSLSIIRHKKNRKRYNPKRILISSNLKFNSSVLEFSPVSSFELEDNKIRFNIPCQK